MRRSGWRINRKRVQWLMEIGTISPKSSSQPGGTRYLSLSFKGQSRHWSQSGLVRRYYLYPYETGIFVSGGNHGLVEPFRAVLADIQHPTIANTDQGSQFTAQIYLEAVESVGTRVSMDGLRRWIDNVVINRVWRSYKYEDVYIKDDVDSFELQSGANVSSTEYNHERPHR